jgi:hypothetical protein
LPADLQPEEVARKIQRRKSCLDDAHGSRIRNLEHYTVADRAYAPCEAAPAHDFADNGHQEVLPFE